MFVRNFYIPALFKKKSAVKIEHIHLALTFSDISKTVFFQKFKSILDFIFKVSSYPYSIVSQCLVVKKKE